MKTGAKPTLRLFLWVGKQPMSQPIVFDRRSDADKAIWEKLAGTLTHSDETITKVVQNRDADGYITSIEYYAGSTLKFTLTIGRDSNKRITSIERT